MFKLYIKHFLLIRDFMSNSTVKLSLHVSPEVNELLENMSEETHTSKSDVLRKSIALMQVAVESKREGQKLAIVDSKHKVIKEIIGI